eukprot:tig00000093_g3523.t1
MAFQFSWPAFDADEIFISSAKKLLTDALNSQPKMPPSIAGKFNVLELRFGEKAPQVAITDVLNLSEENAKIAFSFKYDGDALLRFETTIQANVLAPTSNPRSGWARKKLGILAAANPLIMPLDLTLTDFKIEGAVEVGAVQQLVPAPPGSDSGASEPALSTAAVEEYDLQLDACEEPVRRGSLHDSPVMHRAALSLRHSLASGGATSAPPSLATASSSAMRSSVFRPVSPAHSGSSSSPRSACSDSPEPRTPSPPFSVPPSPFGQRMWSPASAPPHRQRTPSAGRLTPTGSPRQAPAAGLVRQGMLTLRFLNDPLKSLRCVTNFDVIPFAAPTVHGTIEANLRASLHKELVYPPGGCISIPLPALPPIPPNALASLALPQPKSPSGAAASPTPLSPAPTAPFAAGPALESISLDFVRLAAITAAKQEKRERSH